MKRAASLIVLMGLAAIAAYATCTFSETSGNAVCSSDSNCNTYKSPVPVTCGDVGSATGKQFGSSSTNTVTVTIYSGGHCGTDATCSGGTVFSTEQDTQVSSSCASCGG